MNRLRYKILVSALILMSGCSWNLQQAAINNLPCYDGWSRGREGESKVWDPTPEVSLEIANQLPKDRKIGCIQTYPHGRLIVLSADTSGTRWGTEFYFLSGKYVVDLESDGFIVTAR